VSEIPRKRPGGRTARTWAAVRQAVQQLLVEEVPEVLISEVAERAGVHPSTIYRRWGSAENLVLDVALARVQEESPIPATGDLRADLVAYASRLVAGLARPGGLVFLAAATAALRQPGGEVSAISILNRRGDEIRAMLDRAGQDANDLTFIDVIDGILAPIYLRVIFGAGDTLTPEALERLVDRLVPSRPTRPA
jgi:AcrR family transcriptional regulator